MHSYMLFSEYGDRSIWGNTLADAVKRNSGHIHPNMRVDTDRGTKFVPDLSKPLIITRVIGMRDTTKSKRGNWSYESVLVELAPDMPQTAGRIISIDARLVETLSA